MINLSKKILTQIKNHAEECNPNECCGLLIESNQEINIINCENQAEDKLNNFVLSPLSYLNSSKTGKIVAFYHSHCLDEHPNDFTLFDKLNSLNHHLPLILYYLPKNEFKVFDGNKDDKFLKYIGIPFQYNTNDCLNLIEQFYKNELNIILPKIFRDKDWFEKNPKTVDDNMKKFDFTIVEDDLKYGDIILMKKLGSNDISHLAIYIGQNQMLHQKYESYSLVELYDQSHKNFTVGKIRHNQLL